MKQKEFNNYLTQILTKTKQTLATKGTEYAAASADRLHNFRCAAMLEHCTPEKALRGFLTKHIISVYDLIDQLENGVFEDLEVWQEKCGDIRNYLIILEIMVRDRNNKLYRKEQLPQTSPQINNKRFVDSTPHS
jgi:hypothetical protein